MIKYELVLVWCLSESAPESTPLMKPSVSASAPGWGVVQSSGKNTGCTSSDFPNFTANQWEADSCFMGVCIKKEEGGGSGGGGGYVEIAGNLRRK